MLEEVTYERPCQHTNNANTIYEEHCDFWRNSSTERLSRKLIYDTLSAANNTLSLGGTFCNIQKAFRFINHDILLWKLEFYVTVGSAKASIASYIKDSYQQVLINSTTSVWGNVVPQYLIANYNLYVYVKLMYQYTV